VRLHQDDDQQKTVVSSFSRCTLWNENKTFRSILNCKSILGRRTATMATEERIATPVRGSTANRGTVDKYHTVHETSDDVGVIEAEEEEKTDHVIDRADAATDGSVPQNPNAGMMLPPRNNSSHGDTASQSGSSSSGVVAHATKGNPEALRYLRRLRTNRQRVPGGAAAKLIGVTYDAANDPQLASTHQDEDDGIEVVAPTDELDQLRKKAKEEFKVGTSTNRRYHTPQPRRPGELERTMSEASLPSILNRSEVFHENATAAVVSLLAPRFGGKVGSDCGVGSIAGESTFSGRSFGNYDLSPTSPIVGGGPLLARSAFKAPPKRGDLSSVVSIRTASSAFGSSTDGNVYERFDSARSPTEQPFLTPTAEKRVEEMATQMKDPAKTLADLLAAIATPANGDLNRGFMVRRKNACGALQVLTAKKVHRVQICWTVGVLPALTSVLEDGGSEGLVHTFPDVHTRTEYVEARKRAVSSLMNLSMPQQNRLAVFHSPQLIPCIVQTINDDFDESCRGCCAVLAYLAKTPENRILMVQVPGLIDAIASVIKPRPRPQAKVETKRRVKMASHDDEEEEDDAEHSRASSRSKSHSDDEQVLGASTSDVSSEERAVNLEEKDGEEMKVDLSNSESLTDTAARYDNDASEFLHGARQNVFALLGHLVKEKDNAVSCCVFTRVDKTMMFRLTSLPYMSVCCAAFCFIVPSC
jgi:hypothetical protein